MSVPPVPGPVPDFQLAELAALARKRIDPVVHDFLSGGAGAEHTLRANRTAIEAIAFRPRLLRDVSAVDTRSVLFSHALAIPAFIAPMGSLDRLHPDGALACARAADRFGTIAFVSASVSHDLREIRRELPHAPLVLQIYGHPQPAAAKAMLARAEALGCLAVCVTADSAVYGRRDRDLRNRFDARHKPRRPNLSDIEGAADRASWARFTWRELAFMREHTGLPLILKGVTCAEDAGMAVSAGLDAIYVSNHGGRKLDHTPAAITVLPEIVAAATGRAAVIVDGGFMRGVDVVKALALGAAAVGLGRFAGCALAAGGQAGLERALELLAAEIGDTMAMLGLASLDRIDADCLRMDAAR